MFDFLLWTAVVLSAIVIVEVVWFLILSFLLLNKEKKGAKMMSIVAIALVETPFYLPIFCVILLAETVMLGYAIFVLTKELKEVGEAPAFVAPEPELKLEPKPEPEPEPEPEGPTEEEIEIVSELIRETITIEEAHEAITDEMASHFIEIERVESEEPKRYSKKGIINIDTLSENFASGDVVDLASLTAKGLISGGTDSVKVLARGHLDKHLTVEAQDFSADAVKMIILTGGKVIEKI